MELTNQLVQIDSRVREFFKSIGGHSKGLSFETSFEALAVELFAVQFELNPPYRSLCQARGATPGRVKTWQQIPAAPTSAFKELEFSCLTQAERTRVFHSSRTTGQKPSRHFH